MKKIAIVAAIAAATFATPSFAKDEGLIQAYAGPVVGWDHVRASVDDQSGSKDGFVYGGIIGVQTRAGGAGVLGLEAEIDGATTRYVEHDFAETGDTAKIKAGRDIYVGARAGFMAAPNTLLYVKGGYTNARVTASYSSSGGYESASENLDGYRLGAGAEFKMTDHVSFRGEYRYSHYGHLKYDGLDTGVSSQRHQIVFAAIYGF